MEPLLALNVLLVDDQSYNLFVLHEIIMEINPRVKIEEALHGKAGIDKITAAGALQLNGGKTYFDMIFLDLHMPVLDGF